MSRPETAGRDGSGRPDTRIVCLANPNNPTGAHIPHAEIVALLEGLPKGAALMVDCGRPTDQIVTSLRSRWVFIQPGSNRDMSTSIRVSVGHGSRRPGVSGRGPGGRDPSGGRARTLRCRS